MKTLMICSFLLLGFIATPAHAQFDVSGLQGSAPLLTTQPEFPQPGESVVVTADYRGDAYFGATLTWVVDGELVPNSKNQRSITIAATSDSLEQVIDVIFTSPTGVRTIASHTITPLWLDVIIEPQTHVPEFYQGRSLPSIGSTVFVTALVSDIEGMRNTDMVYKWTVNRQVLDEGPVRGRNTMVFEMPMGQAALLLVEISELINPATGQSPGNIITRRLISIPSAQPRLVFYEVNTLLGISHRPIARDFSMVGDSSIIRATPFHLDSFVYNNPARHSWRVNSVETTNSGRGANPYEVMIERTGTTGRTFLEFHVRDNRQVLQGVEDRIQINL